VIHLALFDSQQLRAGNLAGAGVSGVRAVAAMGEALAESGKPLISAAAIGALGPRGRSSTEATPPPRKDREVPRALCWALRSVGCAPRSYACL
jgi:hypothetical protein